MHFSYGQGVRSNFVPPPPSRFMMASGHISNQPSHLPLNSNSNQTLNYSHTVQNSQPIMQTVNRTFVPHHIINEIPIMASETKRYEVA